MDDEIDVSKIKKIKSINPPHVICKSGLESKC